MKTETSQRPAAAITLAVEKVGTDALLEGCALSDRTEKGTSVQHEREFDSHGQLDCIGSESSVMELYFRQIWLP